MDSYLPSLNYFETSKKEREYWIIKNVLRHCFKKKEQSFSYAIRHNTEIYRPLKICSCNFWNADLTKCNTLILVRNCFTWISSVGDLNIYLILVTFRYIWTERFISFTGVDYSHSAIQKVTPMNRPKTKPKRCDNNKKRWRYNSNCG